MTLTVLRTPGQICCRISLNRDLSGVFFSWLDWGLGFGEGFPGGSGGKESACKEGALGLVPGLERSPGEGNDIPLQYSGLENPQGQMSLAGYSPWGLKESDTLRDQHLGIWRRKIRGHKMSFHHIISKVHTINLTNHYWYLLWSHGWGNVLIILRCTVTLLLAALFHNVFFGRSPFSRLHSRVEHFIPPPWGWSIFVNYFKFLCRDHLSFALHLFVHSFIYISVHSWIFISHFGL